MSEITLTIPSGREFRDVAHFVLGGLASPLRLTVEHLEDLQIALGEALARGKDRSLRIELDVGDARLDVVVGPVDHDRVLAELEGEEDELGLRRVREAVVDEVELTSRGGSGWIRFAKVVAARAVS